MGPAGCPGKSCEGVEEVCEKIEKLEEKCRLINYNISTMQNSLKSCSSSSSRCLLQKQIQTNKKAHALLQTKIRNYTQRKNQLSN
jgi:hypothetical protein